MNRGRTAVAIGELQVLRGNPTAEELAALVVALAVRSTSTAPAAEPHVPSVQISRPAHEPPGAWTAAPTVWHAGTDPC